MTTSNYCNRPVGSSGLAGLTFRDIERAAYGAEEIGEHEYKDGKCIYCGQPAPPLEPVAQEEK